jgi:hypothetical protein
MKTLRVNNQWQQALYYLINLDSFSLADVIHDSMFYKFQTRLGEIEQEHGIICTRERKEFTNRFGRKSNHTVYSCIDKEKVLELFNKYN